MLGIWNVNARQWLAHIDFDGSTIHFDGPKARADAESCARWHKQQYGTRFIVREYERPGVPVTTAKVHTTAEVVDVIREA